MSALGKDHKTRELSQREAIRNALQSGKKVSPLSALRDFGCMRLADVIYKLRREGFNIETHTREQGSKRYAVYKMADLEETR